MVTYFPLKVTADRLFDNPMHINREDRLVDTWLTQPKHTHATLSYSRELDSAPSHTPKYFILCFGQFYFSSNDLNSYVDYIVLTICYIVDLSNTSDDLPNVL